MCGPSERSGMSDLNNNDLIRDSYVSFVNLDHRKDRLERMQQTLSKAGLSAVRTRGMLPQEYKGPKEKIAAMLARPQKGAIGCHFSQVSIMEEACRRNQHALVMEDDLMICEDLAERFAIISEFTKSHEWHVIWLGGTFHVNPPYWHGKKLGRDAVLTDNPRMVRTFGAFCTYAYLVNREHLPTVLGLLDEQLPTSIGIDYAFIQIQPRLQTFAFVPGCMTQLDNTSDIGVNKDGSPGFTKFSTFAKLGPYWYQPKMTDFDPTTYNWCEARL